MTLEEETNAFKRVYLIVLDPIGTGEASDAEKFGDVGSDALGHIAKEAGLTIPHLEKLGLGTIALLVSVKTAVDHDSYATKLEEISVGGDTITGHWEITGLNIKEPFRVFPNGFPEELLKQIEDFSGRKVVYNKPYSGAAVVDNYGEHQVKTGDLVVYTSADPVLQIAAYEDTIPLEEPYKICQYIRDITKDESYMIGRIIARPYAGELGNLTRTSNRHNYALDPSGHTVLDPSKENDNGVIIVRKINDIFNGQGITEATRTKSNMDGVDQLLTVMDKDLTGLSFTSLVGSDALYGHRRNMKGYAKAIGDPDGRLPEIMAAMARDDLLLITADHGNDPAFPGTDHIRKYIPLSAYSKKMIKQGSLPQGFHSDISATIAENSEAPAAENDQSFLNQLQ